MHLGWYLGHLLISVNRPVRCEVDTGHLLPVTERDLERVTFRGYFEDGDVSVVVGEFAYLDVRVGGLADDSGEVSLSSTAVYSGSSDEALCPPEVLTQDVEKGCFTGTIRASDDRRPRMEVDLDPAELAPMRDFE